MSQSIAHFFESLTFNQFLILIGVAFAMVVTLIIVLARIPKIAGAEKVKAGKVVVEFDTDDPEPKKRTIRRRTPRVKK